MRPRPAPPAGRRRRDEHGLSSLEWLLIVAAVAGLAALGVVVVSKIVDDTGEQIANPNPMIKAAVLAANTIDLKAAQHPVSDFTDRRSYDRVRAIYDRKCARLNILYDHIPGFESWWIHSPAPSWSEPDDLDKNMKYFYLSFSKDHAMAGCWIEVDGTRFSAHRFTGYKDQQGSIEIEREVCCRRKGGLRKLKSWLPDLNNLSAEDQRIIDSLG
jgi:hypothetical protein